MVMRMLMITLLSGLLSLSAGAVLAAQHEAEQAGAATQEPIYGNELMSEEERAEYREKMRAATSAQEREQIRKEHHERMRERAREQGVTLPDEPPAKGRGGAGYEGGGRYR